MKKEPLKKKISAKREKSPFIDAIKIRTETSGYGTLKMLIAIGLIALQVALFVFLYVSFAYIFTWYLVLSGVLSIATCFLVLSSNKNSLSKSVWIMFLLIFFYFAHVLYILSDERVFFRKSKKRYKAVFKSAEKYLLKENYRTEKEVVNRDLEYLFKVGNFNSFTGTDLKYFPSGTQFFDDVLESLKRAEKFIFMEFFIVAKGNLLNRVFDVLSKKVQEGVLVRLIYDDMGCHKTFGKDEKLRFERAGIRLLPFNRFVPVFSVGLNYRDHRKIVVIDGQTAYTGGCNLADEYVNEKRMHGYWKDTGIRIDGPAVDGLTIIFLSQWEYLSRQSEDYSQYLKKSFKRENKSAVVPFADGLNYDARIGKNVYENMISSAIEQIYFSTPYFIVDDTITNLLINKARSGVDVRIILPEVPDKAFVYGVTRNNAEKLIDHGVKVFVMKRSFVHSKVLITENSVVVGSINMDLRSFYQQCESAVYTDDKAVMADVLDDFRKVEKDSVLLTEKNGLRKGFLYRIAAGLMQIFAPFM